MAKKKVKKKYSRRIRIRRGNYGKSIKTRMFQLHANLIDRNDELKKMVKEMLDAEDVHWTDSEVKWLDIFYKRDHFSNKQENIICEMYRRKM